MRVITILLALTILIGCMKSSSDTFDKQFHKTFSENNIKIDSTDELGLIYASYRGLKFQISLDNARKDFESSGDFEVLDNIVKSIKGSTTENFIFEEIQSYIYPHLIPSDLKIKDVNFDSITDQALLIYVVYKDGKQSFIMSHDLKDWGRSIEEVKEIAYDNLNLMVGKIKIDTVEIEGRPLGFFETDFSMKSTCLLSPVLKQRVEKQFGWPICAVFPVKDFCYFFHEEDLEFFSERLGGTVIEEYSNSPHPISTELVRVKDNGFEVIGEYPRQ